jgi:hypothetical protein
LQRNLLCYDCEKPELPEAFSVVPFSLIINDKADGGPPVERTLNIDEFEGPAVKTSPYVGY